MSCCTEISLSLRSKESNCDLTERGQHPLFKQVLIQIHLSVIDYINLSSPGKSITFEQSILSHHILINYEIVSSLQ